MNILLVEDDSFIADGLVFAFSQDNWYVTHCPTIASAHDALKNGSFDMAVLDINLPDGNGIDLCKAIKTSCKMPVIFLTVCDDEIVTVRGLDLGADDYVTKPFRVRELQSRIKAVLRRSGKSPDKLTLPRGIVLDTAKMTVSRQGEQVALTALEYKLLLTFAQTPNVIINRNSLLQNVWDIDGSFVTDNTLSVSIKRLRQKLEKQGDKPIIKAVRGFGYKLEV